MSCRNKGNTFCGRFPLHTVNWREKHPGYTVFCPTVNRDNVGLSGMPQKIQSRLFVFHPYLWGSLALFSFLPVTLGWLTKKKSCSSKKGHPRHRTTDRVILHIPSIFDAWHQVPVPITCPVGIMQNLNSYVPSTDFSMIHDAKSSTARRKRLWYSGVETSSRNLRYIKYRIVDGSHRTRFASPFTWHLGILFYAD